MSVVMAESGELSVFFFFVFFFVSRHDKLTRLHFALFLLKSMSYFLFESV